MTIVIDGTTGISGVDGTASNPSYEGTDSNTGIFYPAADTVAIGTGGTERLRVDSAGNAGLGVTPSAWQSGAKAIQVNSGGAAISALSGSGALNVTANCYYNGTNWIYSNSYFATRYFNDDGNHIWYTAPSGTAGNAITFTERARITSGGGFYVGKTTGGFSNTGFEVESATGATICTRSGAAPFIVNRITNDGTLIAFYQDGTEEGNITVAGTTVSYNGGHLARYSQLLSGQRDESIVKGTVLSNLDEMCEWLDAEGNPLPNEQLNRTKVSDVEGDTNVAGVFVNWDNDDQDNPYDMNIAMTGDMIIRIAQGVTVQKGDLLMSAGDGTAKPQGDDIVRSKTVAKVTSNHVTCTYDDGSYCVPCVLMAC